MVTQDVFRQRQSVEIRDEGASMIPELDDKAMSIQNTRPFNSTQRVNFMPLARSPASNLYIRRPIFPKHD